MTGWIELALLLVALTAACFLGIDVARSWRRQQEEQRHLERLDDDSQEVARDDLPPPSNAVDSRLKAAGSQLGGIVYLVASAILAVLVFFGILQAFPGNLTAAALAVIVALWIPWSVLGSVARRRARIFEEKLVDAVAFMVSALQAGEIPLRSLATASDAAEKPVAEELARVVSRLDLGMSPGRALRPTIEGYDSEGLRLFAHTLEAKWTAGGDLAPVLLRVNRIMRERLNMRLRLRSELAGARVAGVLVAIMPYVLVPVFLWQRPQWFGALFVNAAGLQLLFFAILLQLIGILWLRRVMRIEQP